jgi:hypothetical protein
MMHDNIDSSFFKLTLLTRCNEVGILYSPKTNYRLATKENMMVKNKLRNSMLESAMNSGNEDEFNQKIALAFYQIAKTNDPENALQLTSIAKETVQLKNTSIENCAVQIDETNAKHVSKFEFLKLCYILNETPRKLTKECEDRDVYDFRTILYGQEPKTITNNDDLRTYVCNTLDWKFFNISDTLTVYQNIWRIRSFLQILTGVGISIVEGAHRLILTAKLLTGMGIDDLIPFDPLQDQDEESVNIPDDSPIWGKANVQVLTPTRNDSEQNNPYRPITQKELIAYQNYSQKVAEQKTHFIESTWKDWIGEVVQSVQQHKHFNTSMNEHEFSKIEEPHPVKGNDDSYIKNYRIVMQVVAACLFELLPAKRLALTALTYTQSKKEKPESVNKKKFITQVTHGKRGNYTHDCWAGVSKH